MKKKIAIVLALFVSTLFFLSVNYNQTYASQNGQETIHKYLDEKKATFSDSADLIDSYAQKYNIDPRLAIAISGAETQFGKDSDGLNCPQYNNPWNFLINGKCMKFDDWDSSIKQVFAQLRKYREHDNLSTIEQIGEVYCTSGCENWLSNVKAFYKEQGGNPETNDYSYPFDLGNNGVDLWQYCLWHWGDQADKSQPVGLDGSTAYDWHCKVISNGKTQSMNISVDEACSWQFSELYETQSPSGNYPSPQIYSRTDDINNPYSWRCYYK